jgi:hypothetical protein
MVTERQHVGDDDAEALDTMSSLNGDHADVDLVDRHFSSLPCPGAGNDHFSLVGVHCHPIQIEAVVYGANTVAAGRLCGAIFQRNVQLRVSSVLRVVNTERADHVGDRRHVQREQQRSQHSTTWATCQ